MPYIQALDFTNVVKWRILNEWFNLFTLILIVAYLIKRIEGVLLPKRPPEEAASIIKINLSFLSQ